MDEFRTDYPAETTEMDDAVARRPTSTGGCTTVSTDDLPRFEAEFKDYLNTNTIRDIAGFSAS